MKTHINVVKLCVIRRAPKALAEKLFKKTIVQGKKYRASAEGASKKEDKI